MKNSEEKWKRLSNQANIDLITHIISKCGRGYSYETKEEWEDSLSLASYPVYQLRKNSLKSEEIEQLFMNKEEYKDVNFRVLLSHVIKLGNEEYESAIEKRRRSGYNL